MLCECRRILNKPYVLLIGVNITAFGRAGGVIFFPINAPGMGRFKLFNLVGSSSSSSFSVQGSVFRRIDALLGEFRVGGGVHDSYTFQCGLVGYFTSPGIDTR